MLLTTVMIEDLLEKVPDQSEQGKGHNTPSQEINLRNDRGGRGNGEAATSQRPKIPKEKTIKIPSAGGVARKLLKSYMVKCELDLGTGKRD